MAGVIFHHSFRVAPGSCVINNLSTMTGKKRGLFSRISGKSAKPDSPKINAASSSSEPTGTSSGLPSSSNNAASSSSQRTGTSSGPSSTSYSPSLAHPAPDEVSEIGSPPIPKKLQDHAKRIRRAAEGVNEENVDANLDELIKYISSLSASIKEKEKEEKKKEMPKLVPDNLSDAKNYMKLKDALSEAINATKDFTSSDAKTIARGFLKDIMGTLNVVNIAFIVMANAWERCEEMSENQEACLSLLEEMNKLAQFVRKLQKGHKTKEGMEASIRDATALIVEASIVCCTQIEASKTRRYFRTTKFGEERAKLEKQLQQMHTHLQELMGLLILEAVDQLKRYNPEYPKDAVGTKKPVQLRKLDYPQHAVGIEDPLNEVIEQLEMGSDKKAVAVILHGFGGMGKTTLADAVFARLFEEKREGCKFSFVTLFQDIKSTPIITDLQELILKDLKGDEPETIRSYRQGQKQIALTLEEEEAFIYIDNVLLPDTQEQGPDALTQLLPNNMGNSKKLRLLITARNTAAATCMTTEIKGVEKKFYPIKILPEKEALNLFMNELDINGKQLDSSQIQRIVNICGGVPALLKVFAGFINAPGKTFQNFDKLIKDSKAKNWIGSEYGHYIEKYVFAFDILEDKLKDPFLDICSFFRGWDWKELSDIVGQTVLEKLEKKALVTLDVKTMTARVHDVILEVGLKKTKGERLRLTSVTEIEDFLDIEDEDLKNIKGIWASYNKDPLRIPAKKLDLMSGSLRVLKLGPLSTVVEGKCEKKFNELVFFSAEISHLPFDVSKFRKFNKLAHLCYHPEDLQNLSQMPSSLRHIEFKLNSPAFEISSNCIQQLSNLRVLSLKNAPLKPQELGDLGKGNLRVLSLKNAQFKSLPEDLGDLGNGLEELNLSNCQYLEDLPASISRLGSLRVLRMGGCSGLRQLPGGLGSLNSLQELYLEGCESLETLPGNLGQLTSLQVLHLDRCRSLEALPSSLEKLSSLRLLDLSNCSGIKDLPCGLGKLTSLAELYLYSCSQLSTIPESIGQLQLNSINLSTTFLKGLPDGFCKFSTLTELDMSFCSCLEKLPERFGELTSLRKLRLAFCDSLKKLPESFSQLKNLEHLDLIGCTTLEELCKDIKDLSLLRILSLEFCEMLQKLPEDFHCLASLEVLDVRYCYKLEGKWIDSMVKMKTLQILRISGSTLLEERWEEIRGQSNQSWSCAVHTEQGLSNEENLLQQFQSKFDSMLTNGEGKPLNISGRPLNTPLLVMFDGQQEFRPDFPLPLLEENIDDIQTHFETVYFGNHWDQLPKKVANRILGHAPANRDAKAFFQKLLSVVDQFDHDQTDFDSRFQMSAEIVSGENGDKYLSRWKFFQWWRQREVEDFVVTKCGRYLKLKQLAERPLGSPIALLRELLAGGEEEISLSFLKKGAATKVGVDELQGKTILLDIRPANICRDIPLQSLVEMYDAEKERFNFEIITVPIMQKSTKLDVSDKFSREVPWLVAQSPWQLTNATKYFLVEGCKLGDMWYPNIMRIIKSDGTMAAYNYPGVLDMVNAWGAAAYPFTADKKMEMIEHEKSQMEALSYAMFLFRHLERVSEQLRKATGQQKMICLCCSDEKEFTNSMKDVLTELSDIIYIIYIPYFTGAEERGDCGYFTSTICQGYSTLEPFKMASAEMQRMFSLSLSEHEAMRFWARMYILIHVIDGSDDQIQLSKMFNGMFIMNEDGNLITTQGKAIVKLLSEKYSDDGRVKELMQQLLKGTQTSWQKTLLELEEML